MKTPLSSLLRVAAFIVVGQHARAERASANYSITADTADAGGQRATSASYSQDGSACSIGGLSTVPAPVGIAKHGYIGQLFDVAGFELTSAAPMLDEGGSLQLGAAYLLDDATYLALVSPSVVWSVTSGPVASVSVEGIATADIVYQDTPATVQGTIGTFTDLLDLTVLDSLLDNYGSYAGDGIDDSWQFQFFGLDNPLAAPAEDPDGDGQTNEFEFTAGLIPDDPLSRFLIRVEPVPGQPDWKDLVFSPLVEGRTYVVKSNSELAGPWLSLGASSTTDDGGQRTVTDLEATEPRKFYHVEISKP